MNSLTLDESQKPDTSNPLAIEGINRVFKYDVSTYEGRVYEATDYLRQKIKDFSPKATLILGTGLGSFADTLESQLIIPTNEVPFFPVSTVPGHAGKIYFGYSNDVPVAVLKGRVHAYEGYSPADVAFSTRVMKLLGCETLITTNAVGAIDKNYKVGDLVIIEDILDKKTFDGCSGIPLGVCGGTTFTDMSEPFTKELIQKAKVIADKYNISSHIGILEMKLGPCFETPHEIRVLSMLGATVVGMSIIPEITAAHQMGYKNVLAISCVSNMAAGVIPGEKIDHESVQEMLNGSKGKYDIFFSELIKNI